MTTTGSTRPGLARTQHFSSGTKRPSSAMATVVGLFVGQACSGIPRFEAGADRGAITPFSFDRFPPRDLTRPHGVGWLLQPEFTVCGVGHAVIKDCRELGQCHGWTGPPVGQVPWPALPRWDNLGQGLHSGHGEAGEVETGEVEAGRDQASPDCYVRPCLSFYFRLGSARTLLGLLDCKEYELEWIKNGCPSG